MNAIASGNNSDYSSTARIKTGLMVLKTPRLCNFLQKQGVNERLCTFQIYHAPSKLSIRFHNLWRPGQSIVLYVDDSCLHLGHRSQKASHHIGAFLDAKK